MAPAAHQRRRSAARQACQCGLGREGTQPLPSQAKQGSRSVPLALARWDSWRRFLNRSCLASAYVLKKCGQLGTQGQPQRTHAERRGDERCIHKIIFKNTKETAGTKGSRGVRCTATRADPHGTLTQTRTSLTKPGSFMSTLNALRVALH